MATATAPAALPGTTNVPSPGEVSDGSEARRWWTWLGVITLAGFGIRLGTVLGRPNRQPGGDAYYFHNAANLLVEGYGFIDPWLFTRHPHEFVQTADWPPLFVFVLAMTSVVGLKSFFAHRVWCCVIGAAAITVCGLTGREIAGRRAGLMAAFLVAVYPNIWMSDELALSESLSPLLVALVLLCAYRFWKQPGTRRMLAFGAALGVAMLGRDEFTLLVPIMLVPLALLARLRWRSRVALAGLGTLAAVVVVAPWVGYNMSRFEKPTFISTGLGITLASANCNQVWSGPFEGYWSYRCSQRAPVDLHADQSVQAAQAQSYALHYIRTHQDRFLRVELARVGGPSASSTLWSRLTSTSSSRHVRTTGRWSVSACTTRWWHSPLAASWYCDGDVSQSFPCWRWASMWWPPCSSASARPVTAPPSRCRWYCSPPSRSTASGTESEEPGPPPTSYAGYLEALTPALRSARRRHRGDERLGSCSTTPDGLSAPGSAVRPPGSSPPRTPLPS